MVVRRLLDIVPSDDSGVSMIVVAFICSEIDFSQELLLVMLELANHFVVVLKRLKGYGGAGQNNFMKPPEADKY